jgi:L-lactate dehydrogenase
MTPNPIAAGIPRDPDPILIDVSMSTTAAGVVARHKALGKKLPGAWVLDSSGQATDDPNAFSNGGSILPIGGVDNGYKGFGMGLLVEALTQSLTGFGRADEPKDWGAGVWVVAFAPAQLTGDQAFRRQTNWIADACIGQESLDPARPIRIPGQLAIERKREALQNGLALPEIVYGRLTALAKRRGVPLPA